MAKWPGGAGGALCLSFDNLGEAAAIELGAIAEDDPSVGEHPTVTRALPSLLAMLGERDLAATFFVEGLNAKLYPDALKAVAAAGHEVAYHAWRHERWSELSATEQARNLARGVETFAALDLDLTGLRPPGGQLGPGGVEVPREAGLRYCSPAGEGAGGENGVALLPFRWDHVDASCVLPGLSPVRERIAGSPDALDPGAFLAYLREELDRLAGDGGFATLVLHLPMLEWWGEARLAALLGALAERSRTGDLWVVRFRDVAEHVLDQPRNFAGGTDLDSTGWGD
jgi:peptidoglycan/xylan/chitin deacetylase (PgdA/CDA1 family)